MISILNNHLNKKLLIQYIYKIEIYCNYSLPLIQVSNFKKLFRHIFEQKILSFAVYVCIYIFFKVLLLFHRLRSRLSLSILIHHSRYFNFLLY